MIVLANNTAGMNRQRISSIERKLKAKRKPGIILVIEENNKYCCMENKQHYKSLEQLKKARAVGEQDTLILIKE